MAQITQLGFCWDDPCAISVISSFYTSNVYAVYETNLTT
jgi:hypothetical protein